MESTQSTGPSEEEKKAPIDNEKKMTDRAKILYTALKAMTAMKLSKEDNTPSEVIDRLYLGSVGVAFNKDSLTKHGITHLLTCADKIQPRYPKVIFMLIICVGL
jgi:hypothetical protein